MTTENLLNILKDHQGKTLLFEYLPNLYVAGNYHITEVKHIAVDSVDCGAQADSWNETIIQLWESPSESPTKKHMSAYKALSILKKVERMKAYDLESEVKFEYSNANFHTAQLFVNDYIIQDGHLIFKLAIEKTDCKAKELCGIPETVDATIQASCEPGSGCC
ncbi:DUF6428 family protein [Winogradskyella immobilis]|uniref:Uncharacterized protein n=1 Tax=Winogradskyella immobilis TaxID=2816852 RepID=A0ABS8EMF8_9FLAO|nr:DUF6428 family protein [Winogradskyella immobilis]MCC1484405.1 hypothetical protein [Winogradskyella immobilis]MCG0016497.1 DUF6428 family protein [Winogradskyella immobilis]